MNAAVTINHTRVMACRWCGQPSSPGPACKICGSPLHLVLHGAPAFSEDLFSQRRFMRAARAKAPRGPGLEARLASQPREPDRPPGEAPAPSQIVVSYSPGPLEVAADGRSEARTVSDTLLVIEPGGWWAAPPAPAMRAAIRREIGRTWVTRVVTFVGSVWLLDFVVNHI